RSWTPEGDDLADENDNYPLDAKFMCDINYGQVWRQHLWDRDMVIKQLFYGGKLPKEVDIHRALVMEERAYRLLRDLQRAGIPKLYYAGMMKQGLCYCVAI